MTIVRVPGAALQAVQIEIMQLGSDQLERHGFERFDCGRDCVLWKGRLPHALHRSDTQFEEIWNIHPDTHSEIRIHGRRVPIPRWQQAFGMDYHFGGDLNRALPIPELLRPLLEWVRSAIDGRLNGLLLNWYDGSLGHYIGRHRDSIVNMVEGAPIVTVSFGETRTFRLREWNSKAAMPPIDCQVRDSDVIVLPYRTNRLFTHEVPASKRQTGRRISVTLRAFIETVR